MSGFDQGSITVPVPTITGSAAALAGPYKIKSSEAFSSALMTVSGLTGETISVQTSPDGYWGAPANPTFYRTDWQGTQLLYSTSRTNAIFYSEGHAGVNWTLTTSGTGVGLGSRTAGFIGPDGVTANATRVTLDIGAGTTASDFCMLWRNAADTTTAAQTYTHSIWMKSNTVLSYQVAMQDAAGTFTIKTVTPQWERFNVVGVAGASVRLRCPLLQGNLATSKSCDVIVADSQIELGSTATSYIPTPAGAAVTVTDYTLSNGIITLAQAPITGATLSYDNSILPSPYFVFGTGNGIQTAFAYDGVWGTLTANSAKGNGIHQIDLRGAQSLKLVKSAGAETATVNMTLKRDALQYKNTAGTWSVT